jgi:hypothetical protein
MAQSTLILEPGGPPQPVINAATTTTLPAIGFVPFTVPASRGGGPYVLYLEAVGASAVPTTVTAQLTCSLDGGVTFQNLGSAINLVATSAGTVAIVTNVVPGAIYLLTLTALTLGSATSVTVWTGF